MITFVLDTSFHRHTSSSWQRGLVKCGDIVVWLLDTMNPLMSKTALVCPFEHCSFPPRVTSTFSSSNDTHSLSILNRQSFVIWVSDFCLSSPSSSTFDNRASISSEIPFQIFLIRFWGCTSFSGYSQIGSWWLKIEFRPISYRIICDDSISFIASPCFVASGPHL